ncbi:hypothetical protein ACUL3X_004698 [Klebsiella oxytoca]
MMKNGIPKISLFNVDENVTSTLSKEGFNTSAHKLNGKHYFKDDTGFSNLSYDFCHDIPNDLHESDIVIIDTKKTSIIDIDEGIPYALYFSRVPPHIDLMPFDIMLIKNQLSSSTKKRCVIVFCAQLNYESYKLINKKINKYDDLTSNTLNLDLYIRPVEKHGSRYNSSTDKKTTRLHQSINKHADELTYNVVFQDASDKDTIFLTNEDKETISWCRFENNTLFLFLPNIKSKDKFLYDLLTNILPDTPFFSDLFPNHGSFQWENDFAYISKEEKDIVIRSNEIDIQYKKAKEFIAQELTKTREKRENQFLKNLLKETDDALVYAVQWFLTYLGFENVQNPDVNVKDGEIFEEDLRIDGEDTTLLIEVKGIGGTSTDAQCSQISKIVLRNRKSYPTHKFHGIYIVNNQRYKAPLQRSHPPFNGKQIEDAEISLRGMTYTYELFQVYHMIEHGILTKQQVREVFFKDGLLDFKSNLTKLPKPHEYTKHHVYSYDLGENENILIKDTDYIIICDNESHWHKLNIISMQVDKQNINSANKGRVGIRVNELIDNAKEHYLLRQ